MSEPESTLYASLDTKHFFLVPEGADLPAGPYVLRSLTGKRLSVEESAMAAYELPEERAKELAQEEVKRVSKHASTLLSGAASLLRDAATKPKSPPLSPKAESTIASALGVTEEQLRNDPKAVLSSLGSVAQGFIATLKDATSEDPAQREAAKQRMEVLANLVKAQTGADTSAMEQMPEKIKEYLRNPELEKTVREATEKLSQATRDLEAYNAAEAAKKTS